MSVNYIAALLSNQGIGATLPVLERRLLVMHATNKTRIELITQADYVLTNQELRSVEALFARRIQGEPIAYILGQREFFGLDLHVTPDVLIPRSDTELLVELSLQFAPPNSDLLDLGTGSGAIAIAVAHQRPDLTIWAADISSAALAIAQQNAITHHCPIHFIESDWYQHLPTHLWHTIVSNPPYIVANDEHLIQGDLRFEPINALTDHADGLSAYRELIKGARGHLISGGWLLLEHGYDQASAVRELLQLAQFSQVQSWQDLAGIERVSGGQLLT